MTRPYDPYDAVLLVSFGGPEGPDDVMDFLRNVTRGKDVPPGRLADVAEHYLAFGGRSPINDQCRALLAAVRADLSAHGIDLPLYWGNRNWHPYLGDTVDQMRRDGIRRAACFVTSAYSSYSGCRQYREDLHDAVAGRTDAPRLDRLRHYFNHPGFVRPFASGVRDALQRLPESGRKGARLVFVTHSVPEQMNAASGRSAGRPGEAYRRQHEEVARLVAEGREHDLVYCSRSGPPSVPWLEPDVNEHLEALAARGVQAVVLVPIGFVSDHMEVVYDLDTEAAATARRVGITLERVPTPGTDPRFVALARDLLLERAAAERAEAAPPARAALGGLGASWDRCPVGCCANPRADRPALGGAA